MCCKKKPAPIEAKGASTEVAVFMDNANDGDEDGLKDIYNDDENEEIREDLLTYVNKRAGATALHLAANNGHAGIVEFLVERIKEDVPDKKEMLINK